MAKVLAGITISVDGCVAGPDDGPGKGLGEGGKRLFDGFTGSIELEQKGTRQSAWATFIEYRVKRSGR